MSNRTHSLTIRVFTTTLFLIPLLCQAQAGSTGPDLNSIKHINEAGFRRHISVLASDAFQGRKPFTIGEKLSTEYLAEQFKKLGLQPGNAGSWLQDVPMVEIKSIPEEGMLVESSESAKGSIKLRFKDDFVAMTRHVVPEVSLEKSDIVFAGFGIVAPEFHWNDYAGLDVKGKTVIVLVNDPGFYNPGLFRGKSMTYYGRWTYKYEEAARQGAAALLIVHETQAASYPWSVVRSSNTGAKLHLKTIDDDRSRAKVEGWINQEAFRNLLKLAGKDTSIIEGAGKPGFKGIDLGLKASMKLKSMFKRSTSHNVIAVLKGSLHSDESIVYSAHWDHLGIGEAVKGDSIYNGALDNASGCAAILEIAEAFKHAKVAPQRSIVFLAVTAEEQGLLGSEYYASHPVFPVAKTVANINIDELQADGRMKDISVIGYGQSEMEDYLKAAAARQHRVITPDQHPENGYFFRSDHFNFAKLGIPALYTENGTNSVLHGQTWGKAKADEYTNEHYHQPSDNYNPESWDFSGMVEDGRLLYDVGYTLAMQRHFPKWKAGSEFRKLRP